MCSAVIREAEIPFVILCVEEENYLLVLSVLC